MGRTRPTASSWSYRSSASQGQGAFSPRQGSDRLDLTPDLSRRISTLDGVAVTRMPDRGSAGDGRRNYGAAISALTLAQSSPLYVQPLALFEKFSRLSDADFGSW
jgi:hypothetical protein